MNKKFGRKPKRKTVYFALAVTLVLLFYQNCSQSLNPPLTQTTSGNGGSSPIQTSPVQQDESELKILNSVLSDYQTCENYAQNSADKNSCYRQALETNKDVLSVSKAAVANTYADNNPDRVCYVLGPKCADRLLSRGDSAMKVALCRSELIAKGSFSLDSLNSLMFADPVGYAETVNAQCLFSNHRCVVAVRCP